MLENHQVKQTILKEDKPHITQEKNNKREYKGWLIAQQATHNTDIIKLGIRDDTFVVSSANVLGISYYVDMLDKSCTCADYMTRKITCKHVHAVKYYSLFKLHHVVRM